MAAEAALALTGLVVKQETTVGQAVEVRNH